jgi:hypothetical protein
MKRSLIAAVVLCFVFASCDYGLIGGADKTETIQPGDPGFANIMSSLSGVWYSRYAGKGRLDGYRIGVWTDFKGLLEDSGKINLFPNAVMPYETYTEQAGTARAAGDYFVFYDDTVFGEGEDGTGGSGGWDSPACYIGIVRAINVFNDDPGRGALIIEYLRGCAPPWLARWPEAAGGGRPFFGVYYHKLSGGSIQMANAVDLAALNSGEPYYTETRDLAGALGKNTIENEAEFISWSVVIPYEKEN